MKKIMFGILLGFLLHKTLAAYHSYIWWSSEASPECRAIHVLSHHEFNQLEECIKAQNPVAATVLPYIIATPTYIFQEWHLHH